MDFFCWAAYDGNGVSRAARPKAHWRRGALRCGDEPRILENALVDPVMMTVSMTDSRHFSIEQANASLPLVGSIVSDMVALSRAMVSRRELLSQVKGQRSEGEQSIYDEELQDVEDCLKVDAERLKSYVDELADLGVHVRSMSDGVVGFPAVFKDRQVYLSWKLGEPCVEFWHGQDEGFEDRRPLEPGPQNRIADQDVVTPSLEN
jgi:hypothetical protein